MKIIPHKLVIEFDENKEFAEGIFIYKKEISGHTEEKFYTMSIKEGVNLVTINNLLRQVRKFVKEQENANE